MSVDLVSEMLFLSMAGAATFSVIDYYGIINFPLVSVIVSVIIGMVVVKITEWLNPV